MLPVWPHLEFHRSGIGLVPIRETEAARGSDSAIYIGKPPGSSKPLRSCSCAESRKKTCAHLRDLGNALREVEERLGTVGFEAAFSASVWYRLARLVFEGSPCPLATVAVEPLAGGVWSLRAASGEELARYFDTSPSHVRLIERLGKSQPAAGTFDRAGLLARLALFLATPEERLFQQRGVRTQRQDWEESFWHRLAYHCFRELGQGTFHPAVDRRDGRFTLTFRSEEKPILRLTVPRDRVQAAMKLLGELFPGQADLAIQPIPLQSILHVTEGTEIDVDRASVRMAIRALQASGEARIFARREKFVYGRLIFLQELSVLAELEVGGRERKFRSPVSMKLKRSQIPSFLEEAEEALGEDRIVFADPSRGRRVFKDYDRLEIHGQASEDPEEALKRRWTWLSASYGFGSETVALSELLAARKAGLPYLEIRGGWIDLQSPAFADLDRLLGVEGLSLPDVLRLRALAGTKERAVEVKGDRAALLERLLDGRPAAPLARLAGLRTVLRPYQEAGVEWLRFLWENRLGGLLCDDMGLGKTHQVMALLVSLAEQEGVELPSLVVCPTSVLPHWRDKIRDFAPGLRAHSYHGTQRSLPPRLEGCDVVLTSYGVLRKSAGDLSAIPFAVAVFDEVQHIKNAGTLSYRAAAELSAEIRLGVTGTPIENALSDLKALFDLVLPGYLGSDSDFEGRYREVGRAREDSARLAELKRVIAPFTLRRLKTTVLAELPEKIEDVRTCALSPEQVKLYRDAVAGKGAELTRQLEAAEGRVPYIHVFALLNQLKQICDHPALALGQLDRAEEFRSGKWDLFCELLSECLDSGQKVVVFTQFLGMIRLMERHLTEKGVLFATLTGASTNRGDLVDRFNRHPDCRVFLGSLKAGGTGIDLVGGSVVIHYDRWWNAAREDQATDRVYRLGQKRAVQVFKLVTEGTLEEKIAALIEKKRRMLDDVVAEDEPHLSKVFTREELLDLLEPV